MKTHVLTEQLDVETSPFAAEDYVQMACQLRRSAELLVRYPDGKTGGIVINKGDLWHAWDNLRSGDEAFLRMVGVARVTQIRSLPPTNPAVRTISQSCQKLILQALITHDSAATNPTTRNTTRNRSGNAYANPTVPPSDSEPTRPNWPALSHHTAKAHSSTPAPDSMASRDTDEGYSPARSYTEHPVEIQASPAMIPRGIATFLPQTRVLQHASVGLLGIILVASVGRIVASPAGGERTNAVERSDPTSASFKAEPLPVRAFARGVTHANTQRNTPGNTGAHAPVEVVGAKPSEVVKVSSLPPATAYPATRVVTRVRLVSVTGDLDDHAVSRHLSGASNQFTACYERTATRSTESVSPNTLSAVVNTNEHGAVSSVSVSGGRWLSLNSCVAGLSERLSTSWGANDGPSRVEWTVSYTPELTPAPHSASNSVH